MAKHVLENCRIFAGGCDLTSASNKVAVMPKLDKEEVTVFGVDGWREYVGSIKGGQFQASGFWEAGDATKVDDEMWSGLGAHGPWSVYPGANQSASAAVDYGSTCYFTDGLTSSYSVFGALGKAAPWEGEADSSWPIVRGKSLHPPGTARSTNGSGTAVEHIAVPAGRYLYAALHVLSIAGTDTPTITVKVQSDVDNTFATPADQITFTGATAVGGQITRTAGAITDTWYRVSWTVSGTTPSFLFIVSLGVA